MTNAPTSAAYREQVATRPAPPTDYRLHSFSSVGYELHVGLDLDRFDPRVADNAPWYVERPAGFREPAKIEWFTDQAHAIVHAANIVAADVEQETGTPEPRVAVEPAKPFEALSSADLEHLGFPLAVGRTAFPHYPAGIMVPIDATAGFLVIDEAEEPGHVDVGVYPNNDGDCLGIWPVHVLRLADVVDALWLQGSRLGYRWAGWAARRLDEEASS